jgi:hypothetical protein
MPISINDYPGLQLPGGSGGGGGAPVQPPASTTEAVAAGDSPSAKTFGAFTDPDALIASYTAAMVNVIGSTAVTGTVLGPYTFSGTADGDAFTLKLNALNGSGQTLATAIHVVSIGIDTSTGAESGTGFQFLFATDVGVTIGTAGTLT